MAFEQIINGYPFDGTRAEMEAFLERLTGFERWVLDRFPRYHGALHFSGSQVGEDSNGTKGVWIAVKDHAGALYPEISKNRSGESIIGPPSDKSLSIEMQLYLPSITNDNQVICQKLSGSNQGLSLHLSASASTGSCVVQFSFVSGSRYLTTDATLTKGRFNHVCAVFNRDEGTPFLSLYVDEELASVSRSRQDFGFTPTDSVDFIIGSGSAISLASTFTPRQTLSGSLDEFRVYHSVRTPAQQRAFAQKPVYATPDLRLYYKFNEPRPLLGSSLSDSVNSIVLDSSGNALHALVNAFTGTLRQAYDDHPENPMVYERSGSFPILFPAHEEVVALNTELLQSASLYDAANPNLITRLIPQHYLTDGADLDGFTEVEGTSGNSYAGSGIPGEGKMGSQQIMLSFLYIWAKFFDELKLYLDAFGNLKYVDYETNDTVPDTFLGLLAKQFGVHLPPLFNGSTIEQYVQGENIGSSVSNEAYPLRYVQQQLMRRVLVNLPDVIRSKGTQHSIKAFLRSMGIDPENSVRIREYGGPTSRQLSFARETKRETNYMLKFTSGSLVVSPFLSSSRREVGHPVPRGNMVLKEQFAPHGVSDNVNDGLLTSGSWTVEGIVKYPPSVVSSLSSVTQSIVRLATTGSNNSRGGLLFNLLAISSSMPRLVLYGRTNVSSSAPLFSLELTFSGSNQHLFDGEHWNFSFGRRRNDEFGSVVSSSFFLRAGRSEGGEITDLIVTSSFFNPSPTTSADALTTISAQENASGTFIVMGAGQTVLSGSSGYAFLNDTVAAPSEARATSMDGWVGNLRFWSLALSESTWREHVRNYKSTGVDDPLTNWGYTSSPSGSWGKLRLDSLSKQQTRTPTSSGAITFWDFSRNGFHLTGSGFPASTEALVGELYDYSYLSPYFDEAVSDDKVRIRSMQDAAITTNTPWIGPAPVYEVPRAEEPTDDTRFSVEFSLVDALNRDIVGIFSTFDSLDNAIGDPSLMFSPDYPDLDRLRDIYFQRLGSKLNFKQFFEFFKWFDTSIGTFIEQLIPRKARFRGTNFLVESHMLERHKLEYHGQEAYLGDTERRSTNRLLLSLIAGNIQKY
jgi:hypothetical protein